MEVLYYDCFAGISGDMNLGALVDLGIPSDYLLGELKKLNISGYNIHITRELKMGISGTKVDVELNTSGDHEHGNEAHSNHHKPSHDHHHTQHRNLKSIRNIIEESTLNQYIKEKSIEMFHEIAEAEAKIHAKSIDEIHFHEVGAVDSIIDIVGAAICIDYLKPDLILSSPVELGGGFVECAHGIFPVPAPATAEILKDIPVKMGRVDKETTTPTGAAILKVFVNEFSESPHFAIKKTSYGIGHRDLAIPNVLRVYLGEQQTSGNLLSAETLMIECNIDDMNPEHYSYIIELLFEAGAQDVFLVPIIMKKSRPAVQLSILCDISEREKFERLILTETTSLGLRYTPMIKSMLERKSRTVDTPYGPIRIKEGILDGKTIKYKAEYDDCVYAARQGKVTLNEVYAAIDNCIHALKLKK
jgi:pyridinium-3,5-bisthiocarboxylic acid mononucleotide nickel chelatase